MQWDHVESREAGVRALCEKGDLDSASTEAIRLYGAEVFGFLLVLHAGDEDIVNDVFSTFCENLWKGLGRFAWECSLRTWAYAVAKNASRTHRRAARRHAQRLMPLSACPALEDMAARIRTETLSYLRTDRRREIGRLREALSDDDQALLTLRVDRDLAWLDLARIFLGDEASSPGALQRESARLRKRFQLVKRQLLELGRQRGLLPERDG
jgi:RNA polymerase sigma-70 factor (ECF subfamily)